MKKLGFLGMITFSYIVCMGQSYQNELEYKLELGGAYTNKDFIPYYLVSNRHGVLSPRLNVGYLRGEIEYKLRTSANFDLNIGIDVIGYAAKSNPYYNNAHLQQLYADVSWWKCSMLLGMKEEHPFLVNENLSSGNMVWSENSRPIPVVKIGTKDFVSVPYTNGWLNFYLDIAYGRQFDRDYNKDFFQSFDLEHNPYRSAQLIENAYMHRKNFFLRSKAAALVVVTAGFEHIAQFGGTINGKKANVKSKDFANVFFAEEGTGENLYSHLASIDLRADVNIKNWTLGVYYQLFMDELPEDGFIYQSGGDGLWGLEWNLKGEAPISSVVLEYLQTSSQGGPVYANEEYKYGTLSEYYTARTYYNDQRYGAWSNYGMANGTPLLKSPIYNKNYYPEFTSTLVEAFHLGVAGNICSQLSYRLLLSHRKTWGEPMALLPHTQENTSGMIECTYKLNDWCFIPSFAFDSGKIYGNNMGLALTIRKNGCLLNKKR